MGRPDVTDKDPFANTEDVPRDNVGVLGFLFRTILRYWLRYLFISLFILGIYYALA